MRGTDDTSICLCAIILPRLEVFFLEEWIIHHLSLGVEKIYIYNNGLRPIAKLNPHWAHDLPEGELDRRLSLSSDPEHMLWEKKPHLNYFSDYNDEEIMELLFSIIGRYPEVELVQWVCGEDHKHPYPTSQLAMFKDAIKRKKQPWLLNIDPDEFIIFKRHPSFQEFLFDYPEVNYFSFFGKVFNMRRKGIPVRKIYNAFGQIRGESSKWLAQISPGIDITLMTPHDLRFEGQTGKKIKNKKTIYFNHYKADGKLLLSKGQTDHIDSTMDKYL